MKKRAINTILIAMLFFTLIPVRADAYVLNSYPFPSSMKDEIYNYVDGGLSSICGSVDTYSKKWNGLSGIKIISTSSSSYASITQSYSSESNGTYAVTYHRSSSRKEIVYYKDFKDASNSIRYETIVHEVGHTLGLAHTQSSNDSISVMRATGFNGKAYPLLDDKEGIDAIY